MKAASLLDPELNLELALLESDYLVRSKKLPAAFALIEDLGSRLTDEGADVYQRIKLLSCKAKLYAKAGKPEMGLSVALRAANASLKVRIIPAAWEAVGVLCNILNSLREFGAAIQLLDAITPNVCCWISALEWQRKLTSSRRSKVAMQCSALSYSPSKLMHTWVQLSWENRNRENEAQAWVKLIGA